MTQPYDPEGLPSPSSALLQLARLKAGMSQRGLLRAAGFDLRLHLAAYDPHDDLLAGLEAGRSESERLRRDRQLQAWRQASPAEDVA